MSEAAFRRVVLVGFMGAGKSAVAKSVADAIGWSSVDADQAIESEEGRSIARIFEQDGEAYFRSVERRVTGSLLEGDHVVVASGGGWAGEGSWVDTLPPGTLSVWLDVTTDEALERVGPDYAERPLLATESGRADADRRHRVRRPSYALAKVRVDTNGSTVDDVSARILELLAEARDEPRTE